jgi:hypothetical protein
MEFIVGAGLIFSGEIRKFRIMALEWLMKSMAPCGSSKKYVKNKALK